MAGNEKIGEPIPIEDIDGSDAPLVDEALEAVSENTATNEDEGASSDEQLIAIKEELRQLSQSVAQLTEMTTKYARRRIRRGAQTAVDRYPVGSVVVAGLAGYWLASRNRR